MKSLIQVCGDPTVDWFRIHHEEIIVRGGVYYWKKTSEDTKVKLSSKPGGSAMSYQLIKEMAANKSTLVEGAMLDEELLHRPQDSRITTSWTVWREFPNQGLSQPAFRLEKWHEFEPGSWDYSAARLKGSPDLLIIQDSNLGFRNCIDGWPEVFSKEVHVDFPAEIIIQLGQYNDDMDNPLLDRIDSLGLSDRTTIITSISDLRSCAVKIGMSLSWERMLAEVCAAVFSPNCPFLSQSDKNLKFKQVIVTLGASGTIIVARDKSTLIFDRNGQEGDFASLYPGQIMGYHACLLGSLASYWADNPAQMDWVKACTIGAKLSRKLHICGYEITEKEGYKQLRFPYQTIAAYYQQLRTNDYKAKDFPDEHICNLGLYTTANDRVMNRTEGDHWTILEEKLLKRQPGSSIFLDPQQAVIECAKNIVLKGPFDAFPDVPVETIGAWSSADRLEIEDVRSVKNAMKEYLQFKNKSEKPLCVAVFGPPGAGKSFVVKEIAKGLGIGEDAQLVFNLTQFESPAELLTAFHQIRDLNVKGKMPLVFWDEFDNPCEGRNLGWLRYFLAPMQDGEFSDQGTSHPLGGGIYVFAGATRRSFEDFQQGNTAEDRAAKKPDFISRLRAYINIRGINGNPNTVEDSLYTIRRAFVLRQYLEINAPQIRTDGHYVIEDGVLDAFLRANKYYHGARSMENLIKMSSLADKRKFELSSLPPDNIIGMHVNVKEFNAMTTMGNRNTLRIGIAGHTHLHPNQTDRLEKAVDEAIHAIEDRFQEHYLTIFSPLAPGADRLAARRLLKQEASRLIAILPFAEEEYVNDFGSSDDYGIDSQGAELRQELKYWLSQKTLETIEMPPSSSRKAAYLKAGYYIAEHSDILLIIWDGNEDKESSITARIYSRAAELGKPICHIWAANFKSASMPSEAEDKCGQIRYINLPDQL